MKATSTSMNVRIEVLKKRIKEQKEPMKISWNGSSSVPWVVIKVQDIANFTTLCQSAGIGFEKTHSGLTADTVDIYLQKCGALEITLPELDFLGKKYDSLNVDDIKEKIVEEN